MPKLEVETQVKKKDLGLVMLDKVTQLILILTVRYVMYNPVLSHLNFTEGDIRSKEGNISNV